MLASESIMACEIKRMCGGNVVWRMWLENKRGGVCCEQPAQRGIILRLYAFRMAYLNVGYSGVVTVNRCKAWRRNGCRNIKRNWRHQAKQRNGSLSIHVGVVT